MLPPDMKMELLEKMDPGDLIRMCQTNKEWKLTCKNSWTRLLYKHFGWIHGGDDKLFMSIEKALRKLVDLAPLQDVYKKYLNEIIYRQLIPVVIEFLDLCIMFKEDERRLTSDDVYGIMFSNKSKYNVAKILLIIKEDTFEGRCPLRTIAESGVEDILKDILTDSDMLLEGSYSDSSDSSESSDSSLD